MIDDFHPKLDTVSLVHLIENDYHSQLGNAGLRKHTLTG